MAKFIIQPHGRLQEWIADGNGYFRDEGLDYEFRSGPSSNTQKLLDTSGQVADLKAAASNPRIRFDKASLLRASSSPGIEYLLGRTTFRH
jgi:hypothetical protein